MTQNSKIKIGSLIHTTLPDKHLIIGIVISKEIMASESPEIAKRPAHETYKPNYFKGDFGSMVGVWYKDFMVEIK